MGRIDLTGTYPGGEGAVLNVQKFSNGQWQDFYSISATVTNGTFSTYIQTGTPGPEPLPRDRLRHQADLQRGQGPDPLSAGPVREPADPAGTR